MIRRSSGNVGLIPHSKRAATPAEGTEQHNGAILTFVVEMQQAQLSLARLVGDECLIAPPRSLDAAGPKSAELRTLGALGKHSGIGAKPALSSAKKRAPTMPRSSFVSEDVEGGKYQGQELATVEKLKALGAPYATFCWFTQVLRPLGRKGNAVCAQMLPAARHRLNRHLALDVNLESPKAIETRIPTLIPAA